MKRTGGKVQLQFFFFINSIVLWLYSESAYEQRQRKSLYYQCYKNDHKSKKYDGVPFRKNSSIL